MTTAVSSRTTSSHQPVLLGAALLLGAAVVVGVVVYLDDSTYRTAGTPFPGTVAALGYALLRLVAAVGGSFSIGALCYALFCTMPAAHGRVDVDGYAGVRVAERASIVWALACLALVPVSAADTAGVSVIDVVRRGALGDLIAAGERPKAWIVASAFALLVAVLLRLTMSWNGLSGLAALGAVAVVAPACVGNAGEGPDHDYGTGAVILFTVALSLLAGLTWCLVEHLRRSDRDADGAARFAAALRRYRIILTSAVVVMVPTGVVLALILAPPSTFGGSYGLLGACAAALLVGHGALVWWLWRRAADSRALSSVLVAAVVAEVLWLAISVAMAVQPAPAFARRAFTAQQVYLGFDLPDPPSVLRMLTLWRFDIVLGTASILLASLYVLGAVRLGRRGDAWSRWRTLSWVVGCVGLLFVTSSGISTYGYAMFSVHMTIHMALNMFIPVLLVLGAPVTMLLRAVEPAGKGHLPGPREWVLSLMHSRFTVLLSNAMIALAVFVVSLYGLYFTPLFGYLIRFHWGHLMMNIHFMLTGYLFYWAIIGIDPGPRRLPHLGRLGLLFAVMPFHAFFGLAVMMSDNVIGKQFYPQLGLGWLISLTDDQHLGGALAWVSGEVPVLLVVGALLSQWAKQDRRTEVRTERHQKSFPEDDELVAYNAMLADLARNRR